MVGKWRQLYLNNNKKCEKKILKIKIKYSHNNIPLHTAQNGHHKQINKQQVVVKLRRKGNPSALLVGMQTGAATVENSMDFPQNTKNITAF